MAARPMAGKTYLLSFRRCLVGIWGRGEGKSLHVVALAWDVEFVVVGEGWEGGSTSEESAALGIFHGGFKGAFRVCGWI